VISGDTVLTVLLERTRVDLPAAATFAAGSRWVLHHFDVGLKGHGGEHPGGADSCHANMCLVCDVRWESEARGKGRRRKLLPILDFELLVWWFLVVRLLFSLRLWLSVTLFFL
jgi:hypothetical protein